MGMTQEGVPSLTREQIEELREELKISVYCASPNSKWLGKRMAAISALCDLALQSLPAEPRQGETPRTDAVALDQREGVMHPDLCETYMAWTDYWALRELARKLERELNAHQSRASSGSDTEAVTGAEDHGNLASTSSGSVPDAEAKA
jgi:hypothetical protein